MSKRPRNDECEESPQSKKRLRPNFPDRLSSLSDEVLLTILNPLPVSTLLSCQRVSRRFHALAGDSELWKRKYYARWVWPRARRVPQLRDLANSTSSSWYSSRLSKWLDHAHLVDGGKRTNWKKQYRLRHNWSKGSCRVSEVEVAQPPIPPVLVKLYRGIVFTADASNGLRAWSTSNEKQCLARVPLLSDAEHNRERGPPTSLAAGSKEPVQGEIEVTVGFEDGSFTIFSLDLAEGRFTERFTHPASTNGAITCVSCSYPYLLTLSQNKVLSLYRCRSEREGISRTPQLMTSLRASNILTPLSLSVRNSSTGIIASIAYSFSRIGCGWSVGLQELRLDQDGESLGSRLATTVDTQFGGNSFMPGVAGGKISQDSDDPMSSWAADQTQTSLSNPLLSHTQPPTSLSYSHPYLLASHADNTLTMYLVVSTSDSLRIRTGRRLWGHTSSVSGVEVSERGKAVSVSARGNEIRVWELEGMIPSPTASRRTLRREGSVQISPENGRQAKGSEPLDLGLVSEAIGRRGNGLGLALENVSNELALMRGWVGFDDEQVVVLRERDVGTQLLECYDFT
ncbi:hypothetical protein FQN54_005815 [Arachnomyces sp. PD_36]|nr:hypothetical protein FQN54_005815 [Arachnomyces sp. PD_36]